MHKGRPQGRGLPGVRTVFDACLTLSPLCFPALEPNRNTLGSSCGKSGRKRKAHEDSSFCGAADRRRPAPDGVPGWQNGPPAGAPDGSGPEDEGAATAVTVTLSPADGAEKVALGSPIRLTFSAPMAQKATAGALSIKPEMSCAPAWSEGGTVLECVPVEQRRPASPRRQRIPAPRRHPAFLTPTPLMPAAVSGIDPGSYTENNRNVN